MAISNDSIQKLLPLLRPYLRDENERRAYLIRALGMDTPVLNRLVLNTPVDVFITSMVKELVDFGKIATGKPALCALLEVIREDVGVDIKARIDELLRQLGEELTETPVSSEQVQSKREEQTQSSVPIDEHRGYKQTSFVSELRKLLVDEKQVYDLSRNEEFAAFNFIGFKETRLTIELVAFVKADGLTEQQIVNLRDRFFNITQLVSYDFGTKPGPRMPNGLLGFVFENECPSFLINFIKKQTKISHSGRSAVIVSWAIDVKHKQIHTHNNPVSLFPPVVLMEDWVFPGLDYLKSFVSAYRPQTVDKDSNRTDSKPVNEQVASEFSRLEERLEEIHKVIQVMSDQQSKYNFPNAQRVQIFEQVSTYIENNNVAEQDIKQSLEDLKQLIEGLQQQYPQASEKQAADIIDAEFKEIQRTQPKRWQNFLSLKRLWNGVKKGSLKAGEHFAEETPWGKAALGFLEGITDEAQ